MATMQPPNPQYGGAPIKKKTNPLVWILIGIVGLFMFIGLALGVITIFAVHKVKQFGNEMKSNPGLAMTKMMARMSPNAEILSTNDSNGTITVKDRTSGKVMTMKFDPDTKKMVMIGDDGKQVEISASGNGPNGNVQIKSSDGTMKFGGGDKAPAWVPAYPGSSPQGNFSAQGPEGSTTTFSFKTKDSPDKVRSYYADAVKSGGLKVTNTYSGQGATGSSAMMTAEDSDKKRTLLVMIGTSEGDTTVNVTASEKK
ncbi:MAG TPA: hypothetical protein VKV15_26760 [Bryobacteraceae bacterium]|nr:hypothetical protein [Bryobacteraceae bacterium]